MQLLLGTDALPSFDTTPPHTAGGRPTPPTLMNTGTDSQRPLPQGMASEVGWGSPTRPRSAVPSHLQRRESRGEHRLQGQLTPISGVVAGLVDAALSDPGRDAASPSMRPGTPGSLSDVALAEPPRPVDAAASDGRTRSSAM